MSYANKFSANDFMEKVSSIAKRAGSKLVYAALILYYTLQSDNVSKADKAIIIGALGYMISPLDVMPDAIPIVGLSDDLAVLLYVLKKVWIMRDLVLLMNLTLPLGLKIFQINSRMINTLFLKIKNILN